MTLRARPHLHYAPVPGGVYFGGARQQFALRGSDAMFTVADVCVPLLERGATEDELVSALGSQRARPAVRHLIASLRDHDMLLDPERLTEPEPSWELRERHAESLAHLEAVADDPYAAFARLRASTVLLVGPREAVRPAARGLDRAGVRRLVQDCSETGGDGAVYCTTADTATDGALLKVRRTLRNAPVVPVLLDDRVMLVGPACREPSDDRAWAPLVRRVLSWSDAESTTPTARPTGDALAGALAGQLLFEVLTGLADEHKAHVVLGEELVADQLAVNTGAAADGGQQASVDRSQQGGHRLDRVEIAPGPESTEAVTRAGVATRRWTGLFALAAGADLPQMPLALREIQPRAAGTGPVVAWAWDQNSATVAVTLEALRRCCPGVGAAGLTEAHWLLDGALRLLVPAAEPLTTVSVPDMDPETLRIWRSLQRHGADSAVLRLCHVPGVDWRLCRVEWTSTGEVFSQGWGHGVADAAYEAVATALARCQVAELTGRPEAVAELSTGALLRTDSANLATLHRQVSAWATAHAACYRGHSRRSDPVLGDLPLWFGPVESNLRADAR